MKNTAWSLVYIFACLVLMVLSNSSWAGDRGHKGDERPAPPPPNHDRLIAAQKKVTDAETEVTKAHAGLEKAAAKARETTESSPELAVALGQLKEARIAYEAARAAALKQIADR